MAYEIKKRNYLAKQFGVSKEDAKEAIKKFEEWDTQGTLSTDRENAEQIRMCLQEIRDNQFSGPVVVTTEIMLDGLHALDSEILELESTAGTLTPAEVEGYEPEENGGEIDD